MLKYTAIKDGVLTTSSRDNLKDMLAGVYLYDIEDDVVHKKIEIAEFDDLGGIVAVEDGKIYSYIKGEDGLTKKECPVKILYLVSTYVVSGESV